MKNIVNNLIEKEHRFLKIFLICVYSVGLMWIYIITISDEDMITDLIGEMNTGTKFVLCFILFLLYVIITLFTNAVMKFLECFCYKLANFEDFNAKIVKRKTYWTMLYIYILHFVMIVAFHFITENIIILVLIYCLPVIVGLFITLYYDKSLKGIKKVIPFIPYVAYVVFDLYMFLQSNMNLS